MVGQPAYPARRCCSTGLPPSTVHGTFIHAHTYKLRMHIYHRELGPLRGFFLPADKDNRHLVIRKCWHQS